MIKLDVAMLRPPAKFCCLCYECPGVLSVIDENWKHAAEGERMMGRWCCW